MCCVTENKNLWLPDSSLPVLLSFHFTQTITWILDRIFYCYFLETLRQYVDTHTNKHLLTHYEYFLDYFWKKWFQLLLFHFFHLLYVVFVRVLKQEQFYQYIAQLQKYLYMQKKIYPVLSLILISDHRKPNPLFLAPPWGSNDKGTYLAPYDLR